MDGILVQLPLPKTINEEVVLNSIVPEKDADGFHPLNVGKLSTSQKNDESLMIPCTPYGCLLLLRELNIILTGKNAVVIGRSNIVGKPMAQLLLKESCTVTTVHSKTINMESICKNADILIARAFSELNNLIEIAFRHRKKEGTCLFLKGKNYRIELDKTLNYWFFDYDIVGSLSSSSGKIIRVKKIFKR